MGNGDGTFQNEVYYNVGTNPDSIVVGNFGNGRADLAVANQGSNNVSILLGNGDGTFQNAVSYNVGTAPVSIALGNFGNGQTDLAVANQGSNNVSILLGNGNGTFQGAVSYAVGAYPESVVAGDFNGDGNLDLATANFGSNNVSVLLGNGAGAFAAQTNYATGVGPLSLVAADFNADGKSDLIVATGSYALGTKLSTYPGFYNSSGNFTAAALNGFADNYWVGATIHFRVGWENATIETGTVTSSTSGSVTFSYISDTNTGDFDPITGNLFYLDGKTGLGNHFQDLDTSGEWYLDTTAQKLYLWTPTGDSPASETAT